MKVKISDKNSVNLKVGKVADEIIILIRKNQYQCSDDNLRSMVYDTIVKNLKQTK